MSSARVLTTIELGGARYDAAAAAARWPVEIRYRDASAPLGRPAEVVLRATVAGAMVAVTVPFSRAARAEWTAFVPAPVGRMSYEVLVGGAAVAAGGLDVHAPAKPLALSRAVSELRHSAPSGAHVVGGGKSGGGGGRTVCFAFVEEVFTVRDVFVECDALEEPLRLAKRRRGEAVVLDIREDAFVGTVTLPYGRYKFRFRVVLKEPARPDAAPFTTLGWDPAQSHSGGLATWEQSVEIEQGAPVEKAAATNEAAAVTTETAAIKEVATAKEVAAAKEVTTAKKVTATKAVAAVQEVAAPKGLDAIHEATAGKNSAVSQVDSAAQEVPVTSEAALEKVAGETKAAVAAGDLGKAKAKPSPVMQPAPAAEAVPEESAGMVPSAAESTTSVEPESVLVEPQEDTAVAAIETVQKTVEQVSDIGKVHGADASGANEVADGRKPGGKIGIVAVVCVALFAICIGFARSSESSDDEIFIRRDVEENDVRDSPRLSVREQYLQHSKGQGY